ncbi:hypothetical protein G4Y79_23580 [Phototrophicus methaneseepsis]|uniref:Uncharacterized protein n=1 Tax=Phototrophicus methaneseepsis TaxID=2710758 RepID=A0A7S8IEN5_9CHLR|nr:hypothetical protein [Phototrophicus methaneseepsis]QPC82634.1 hypothetical protein G4Y79_23580 [Phototrophicus methaneseepsis]
MRTQSPAEILERYCSGSYCRMLTFMTIGLASFLLILTLVSSVLALSL